jgi:hypothetical protein
LKTHFSFGSSSAFYSLGHSDFIKILAPIDQCGTGSGWMTIQANTTGGKPMCGAADGDSGTIFSYDFEFPQNGPKFSLKPLQ